MSIPKIDLSDFIEKWKSAKRGKEVRQASTDAFEQIQRIVNEALQKCYDEATGNPESILAHTGNTKNPHETKAANLPVTDTYGAAGTAGNTVFMQALADALADKIVNQVLTKGELINNALATEAGVAALDAAMGKTLQDQITQQNSNLIYCKTVAVRIAAEAGLDYNETVAHGLSPDKVIAYFIGSVVGSSSTSDITFCHMLGRDTIRIRSARSQDVTVMVGYIYSK